MNTTNSGYASYSGILQQSACLHMASGMFSLSPERCTQTYQTTTGYKVAVETHAYKREDQFQEMHSPSLRKQLSSKIVFFSEYKDKKQNIMCT